MWNDYAGAVIKDKDGFIWIPTDRGLYRFDGTNFKNYHHDPANKKSLPTNHVGWIYQDKKGRYWCYLEETGLYRFDPLTQAFTPYHNNNKDVSLDGYQLGYPYEDPNGDLWFGVNAYGLGTIQMADNTLHLHPTCKNHFRCGDYRSSTWITKVREAADGSLWCASNYGLVHFHPGSGDFDVLMDKQDSGPVSNEIFTCTDLFLDKDNTIWVSTWGKGLFHYFPATNRWVQFKTEPEHYGDGTHNIVSCVYPKSENELWVYTFNNGLSIFDKQTHRIVPVQSFCYNAEGNKKIRSAVQFRDEHGLFWGAGFQGLLKINPAENLFQWTAVQRGWLLNGEAFRFTSFRLFPGDDHLYLGSYYGEGLYAYDIKTGKAKSYPWKAARGVLNVYSLYTDNQGNFWVCTNDGVFLFSRQTKTYSRPAFPQAIPKNRLVEAMAEDREGNYWLATDGHGILKYNPGDKTVIAFNTRAPIQRRIPDDEVFTLCPDQKGNIWFGCHARGVGCITAGANRIILYNKTTGYVESNASCITATGDGKILYGLGHLGLAALTYPLTDSCRQQIYTTSDGLPGDALSWLGRDSTGRVWIFCNGGISRCEMRTMAFQTYNTTDGLESNALWGSGYIDSGNNLYVGANEGFNTLNLNNLRHGLDMPGRITIHSFQINGTAFEKDINYLGGVDLLHTQNDLSFELGSMTYTGNKYLSYAYQMEGLDTAWMNIGGRRVISFTGLAPGDYVLHVKAATRFGVWSGHTLDFRIREKPAFWQTSWFKSLMFFIAGLIIFAIVYYQFSRVKKEAALKQQRAEAEMAALRAQMNPHFIFNCMNTIDAYIHKNRHHEASEFLHEFSDLMRMVLENSRLDLVPLERDLQALRLYISLEEQRNKHRFTHYIDLPEELAAENYHIPPMLIQPFVENAILHGLRHKEGGGGLLSIRFTKTADSLVCTIGDNGIGRSKAAAINQGTASEQSSLGIRVTRERLHLLQVHSSKKATAEIADGADGQGTIVILTLPLIQKH